MLKLGPSVQPFRSYYYFVQYSKFVFSAGWCTYTFTLSGFLFVFFSVVGYNLVYFYKDGSKNRMGVYVPFSRRLLLTRYFFECV